MQGLSDLFLLNANIKSLAAAGTFHGVLTLGAGESQHLFAMLAFAINMRFAITPFVFLQCEKALDASRLSLIPLVFALPLVYVARQDAEHDIRAECQLQRGHYGCQWLL